MSEMHAHLAGAGTSLAREMLAELLRGLIDRASKDLNIVSIRFFSRRGWTVRGEGTRQRKEVRED